MKRIALTLAVLISLVYRLIPFGLRRRLIMGLTVLESRIGAPADALKRLYGVEDSLQLVINERAMALGDGEQQQGSVANKAPRDGWEAMEDGVF